MIYVIYYLLWIINIILLLLNKKSKLVSTLTFLLFFLLFAANPGQFGDAYKYRIDYELNAFGDEWSEIGYSLFKTFTYFIGLNSYNSFLIVIFIASSLLICRGMRLINGNYHAIYAVSMGFLFPMFATTIRFFMAFAIFVYALHFLYQRKKIQYVIAIIIATTFHWTALVFLIMPFCVSREFNEIVLKKNVRKIEIGLLVVITLVFVVITYYTKRFPFVDLITNAVLTWFPELDIKVNAYIGTITRFGSLIFFGVYFVNLYASVVMRKVVGLIVARNELASCENLYSFSESTFLCNAVSAILLPFLVLNLVFFRLLVLSTFMNTVLIGMILKFNRRSDVVKVNIRKCLLVFFLIIVIWTVPEIVAVNSITIRSMIENLSFIL